VILEYYNTVEDIVAFNLHACAASIRRSRIRCAMYACVPPILGCLLISVRTGSVFDHAGLIALTLAVSAVFAAVFYVRVPISMRREVRRLLSTGRNTGVVGLHILEVDEHGSSERTDMSETRYPWRAVQKIDDTEHYVYIFVSALAAHTIPRTSENATAVNAFVSRARQLWADSQSDGVEA
jgi:hypothetical protein